MKSIEDVKILVVGDIMLDKYVECNIDRISPEAPVPVCNVINEYYTLGGAGNVVRNICELGAEVDCLASVGPDINAVVLNDELTKVGATPILFNGSETTIVKERIIADQRKVQMLRIDHEVVKPIQSKIPIEMFESRCKGKDYDIIVVSDYAKGMITHGLMTFLKRNRVRIIVDPKPANGGMYNGVFMVTPNKKEWKQMIFSSAYTLGNVEYILETRGSKGMVLINNQLDITTRIPTNEVKVSNVSGCGDVVVATMAVCLSSGYDSLTSAKIANKCAGYTASLPSTSIITKEKFDIFLKEILGS